MSNSNADLSHIYKKIIKSASGTLGLIVTATILNLIIAILLARYLGVSGYGQYTLAMTVVGVLAIPTTLGLPNLVVRLVAAYEVKKQWNLLKGIIQFSHYTTVILSLVFSVVAYFLAEQYIVVFNTDNSDIFKAAIMMLPFLAVIAIQGAAMRGLHQAIRGQFSETLFKSTLFFVFVVLLYFSERQESAETIMFVQVICVFMAFILSAIFMKNSLPSEVKLIESKMDINKWVKSAIPLFFMGGVQLINQKTDLLMIGHFMTESSVGVYQVALKFSEVSVFVLSAINIAISPTISALYHEEKISAVQNLMTRSARYITVLIIPIIIIILFVGEQLIVLVFGAAYAEAYLPLVILLIGQLINALVGSVALLLIMTGFEKWATIGLVISATVNVFLNIILIPEYGIIGAAIATSASMVIWNVILFWFCIDKVSINCSVFRFRKDTH